jgi:hypothetical protein
MGFFERDKPTRRQAAPVQPQDQDADAPVPMSPLSEAERAELAAAEDRIKAGLMSYCDAGLALATIKDQALYRDQFATFAAYLDVRWKMSNDFANKLMAGMRVAFELRDAGLLAPLREVHARELGRIAPEHRAEVWAATLADVDGDAERVTVDQIAAHAPPRLRKMKGKGKGKGKQVKPPKPLRIRGRGWIITIERRKEIDPSTILAAAEMQLRNRSIRAAA